MTAVILAAGAGTRLRGSDVVRPKCLASIGAAPLIDFQIEALRASGLDDIVVVVGFEAERVRLACGPQVRCIENPIFAATNSLYSLWLAREVLSEGFVVMNCDVLFHPQLLRDLLTARYPDALLVAFSEEGQVPYGDEEMKVQVRGGRVTRIAKDLPLADTDGENVGIGKFSADGAARLVKVMDRIVGDGRLREWAPRAFGEFARERALYAVGTRGLPWTEIDTPEDYQHATANIFPTIAVDAGLFGSQALRRGA